MWKKLIWLIIPLLLIASSAQAQSGVAYTRYDVQIEVREDGTMLVREYQHLRFNGEYSEGFAEIPLELMTDIRGINVYGGHDVDHLEPYDFVGIGPKSYRFEVDDDFIYVDWEYEETRPGNEMVFLLEYEVEGGLWVYDEIVTMEWRAIAADRSGLDVPASRVTVDLPFAVSADQLDTIAFGPEYTATIEPLDTGQRVIFEATESIPDGMRFQVIVDFPPGLVTAAKQIWQIEEDQARLEYRVDAVDIEMVVGADGRIHVTENEQISVEAGILDEGYRDFNLLFVEGVTLQELREGDQPFQLVTGALCAYCYTELQLPRQPDWVYYNETADEVLFRDSAAGLARFNWGLPGLVRGESTTLTLAYEVEGAFTVEADGHLLTWTAVSAQEIAPEKISLRLQLPANLGWEDVHIEGAAVSRVEGGLLLRPEQPLPAWRDWQFTLLLPAGTLNTTAPPWQTEMKTKFDEAAVIRAAKAEREAQMQLALQAGGIGAGITAVLGAIATWYLWGSRKVREAMGNYRTTPPSNLPPGIVAYLLDGQATGKSALASLFYLADLGLIRLNLGEQLMLERLREGGVTANQAITTPTGETVKVPDHVAMLFNKLLPDLPMGETQPFTAVQDTFHQAMPPMYTAMAQEMVTYFYGRKGKRLAAGNALNILPIAAFLLFVALAAFVLPNTQATVPLLFCGFFVTMVAIMVFIARSTKPSSNLTTLGKLESKRWQGFKTYLQDIQKYGDLAEAQEILDRYFAYAIALGVDESLLAQVGDWGGYAPVWVGNGRLADGTTWHNRPYDRRFHRRSWYQRGSWLPRQQQPVTQPKPAADQARPSLQTISNHLTRSLNETSGKMTTLLNTAVGAGQAQSITIRAAGQTKSVIWQPESSINSVISEIMKESRNIQPPRPPSSSGGSSGSGGSSSGGFRSSGSSSRRSSSRSSGRSSSRSSSSRRSGGGGRRGFK